MEIKIPEVGESVREALVAKWHVASGARINRDQPVCELETDKITLELNAEATGTVTIMVPAGQTVPIGTVIGIIDEAAATGASLPGAETGMATAAQGSLFEMSPPAISAWQPAPASPPPATVPVSPSFPLLPAAASPAVRKLAREQGVDLSGISGSGPSGQVLVHDLTKTGSEGRGTRNEELRAGYEAEMTGRGSEGALLVRSEEPVSYDIASPSLSPEPRTSNLEPRTLNSEPRTSDLEPADRETRTPMSPIRKRIAERLVAVRQQTAMLTTFTEADLTAIKELRAKYREPFQKKYGVDLGYMGFFVKACVAALKEFPAVNARIDGSDIVYHHYYDIGIAIGAAKGLVVPVLRGADQQQFHDIEQQIAEFVAKTKENRLAIADLAGGTFTITNGGVYGSLMSTPILNPPQSAVLGMHAIQDRPVVREGQIVIRPMMYLALSYDHRLIDGREAVQFLKRVKEYLEDPQELRLEG